MTARAAPHPMTARAAPHPTADRTDPARTVVPAARAARATVPAVRAAAPAAGARRRSRSGTGVRAEPGRAGHHHHPAGHLATPLRGPRRRRRVRAPGRRRRPRPGRRRRPPPPHPLVRHRPQPRRHRRRPRLPARRHPPPGTGPPGAGRPAALLTIPLTPVTRGPCDHAHAEIGYHPSRKLAHLIRARSATCTAPGCRRPAARCDLDHTRPGRRRRDLRMQPGPAVQSITTHMLASLGWNHDREQLGTTIAPNCA